MGCADLDLYYKNTMYLYNDDVNWSEGTTLISELMHQENMTAFALIGHCLFKKCTTYMFTQVYTRSTPARIPESAGFQ